LFALRATRKMPLHPTRRDIMCIEKLVRNIGFALAAGGIVIGLGATIEYQPVINALAR
jgi:hypothetical protein